MEMEEEDERKKGLSREICVEEMGNKLEILAHAAKERENCAKEVEKCKKPRICIEYLVRKLLADRDARLAKCVSVFNRQKTEFDRIVALNRDLLQRIDELQKE